MNTWTTVMRPKSMKNHSGAQRLINVEQMTYQSNTLFQNRIAQTD